MQPPSTREFVLCVPASSHLSSPSRSSARPLIVAARPRREATPPPSAAAFRSHPSGASRPASATSPVRSRPGRRQPPVRHQHRRQLARHRRLHRPGEPDADRARRPRPYGAGDQQRRGEGRTRRGRAGSRPEDRSRVRASFFETDGDFVGSRAARRAAGHGDVLARRRRRCSPTKANRTTSTRSIPTGSVSIVRAGVVPVIAPTNIRRRPW